MAIEEEAMMAIRTETAIQAGSVQSQLARLQEGIDNAGKVTSALTEALAHHVRPLDTDTAGLLKSTPPAGTSQAHDRLDTMAYELETSISRLRDLLARLDV